MIDTSQLVVSCAFIFGAILGSFLNVVVLRFGKSSIVFGRSHCPNCKHILRPYELVPILSFFLLGGSCSKCHKRISWQYPLVELATAIGSAYLAFQTIQGDYPFIVFFYGIVVYALLVAIVVYDIKHTIVPDSFVFPLAAITFFALCINPATLTFKLPSVTEVLSGIVLALPFALLWVISKGRWIGLGDAKLALPIGWILGITAGFTALAFAFWSGAIVAIVLLLVSRLLHTREQLTMKSEVPFAPFIVFGAILVYLTGINFFLII